MESKEQNVVNRLVQWAQAHPLIRVLILTSSRANPHAPLDP
ncbi:MAG TPA: aminoglycoside 6-adenylyltransferase [Herpetosiphonaceae bacterium]|nr:aminoglycoside 6-adenylyltransferase [Herpetosiphonaceae bacterium]